MSRSLICRSICSTRLILWEVSSLCCDKLGIVLLDSIYVNLMEREDNSMNFMNKFGAVSPLTTDDIIVQSSIGYVSFRHQKRITF